MDLKGDYVYGRSDGRPTANESNHVTTHYRQPSYLAAIGITDPLQAAEPILAFEPVCSVGARKSTDNPHPDRVNRCGHNEDPYSRSTSCREINSSSCDSKTDSLSSVLTSGSHGYANSQIGGGMGVGEIAKVSHMYNSSNAHHPNKMHFNYKSNVEFGDIQDQSCQDVNSVQFSNVKNIPHSVMAPMSRYATDFNSQSNRFLSHPKTTKLVGNKEKNEETCSSNYSKLYSFASNAGKSQVANDNTCHNAVWLNTNQPGLADPQHRGQGRQTRQTSCSGAKNDDYDYIHPHQVQHLLSLQRSHKTSASCNKKEGNASVVSRQPGVPAEAYSTDSRDADGRYCETVAGLSNVFLEADRISTGSTSTGSSGASRCDFDYGSSHQTYSLTGNSSQSPDVPSRGYTPSQSFHHLSSRDLKEHSDVQGGKQRTNHTNLRSVSHQCDSNDLPKYTEVIESVQPLSGWKEMNSSERNQRISALNISSKICHKNQMVDAPKSKSPYDYRNEDVKYLQMLNKQVELYRARDEEHMENYKIPLPETGLNPDVQTRRATAFSSCIGIEKSPPDTAVNSNISKCYGSTAFNEYNLNCRATSDRMDYLISQKKNLRLNQIGRGSHDKIHGDLGISQLKERLQTSDRSDAGSGSLSGSGDNESPLLPCSKRDTVGQPCSFTEDIVSTWAVTKENNVGEDPDVQVADNQDFTKDGKQLKKNVSFSDSVALIAGVEELLHQKVDYVEYATSFLQKRTKGLQSYEVKDDKNSQAETSSHGSLSSESRSNSSGSRSNSNVSIPESSSSSGNTQDRDSDFYENDLSSECSENDSEGTTIDESGKCRCSLCHKRWIDTSEVYCRDCYFYMSKFQ